MPKSALYRLLLLAAAQAGLAAGCAEFEDLAHYARLEESTRILLLEHPRFLEARELFLKEKEPPGMVLVGEEVETLVGLMTEVEKLDPPPEAAPTFALVFYPEDRIEFRALVLDQYLNFWPGFEYINEPFKGYYAEPPPDFKNRLLALIFRNPRFSAHLLERIKASEPDALSRPEGEGK